MGHSNLIFGRPLQVGKDPLIDDRWNDPNTIPASNGPIAITTPPERPNFTLGEDGQTVEFMLPFPMHVVDHADWPPLSCSSSGKRIKIYKPEPLQSPSKPEPLQNASKPDGTLGNQPPDAFSSVIRIGCASSKDVGTYPSAADLWPTVERLCEWIRVKCRHYWLLHGQAGFSATVRAAVLTQGDGVISQKNVTAYGRNLIVRPLDCDIWKSIEAELQADAEPPVSEGLYCDAMISAFSGDEVKALLEIGVAAEVEMTDLLSTLCNTQPINAVKNKFLQQKPHLLKFYHKLCEWPQKLGLQAADKFIRPGLPPNWVDLVRELYKLRNSVAHSGKIKGVGTVQPVSTYVFAANALFAYSRAQRLNSGLPCYSYPLGREPYTQIMIFRDGLISSETSVASSRIG